MFICYYYKGRANRSLLCHLKFPPLNMSKCTRHTFTVLFRTMHCQMFSFYLRFSFILTIQTNNYNFRLKNMQLLLTTWRRFLVMNYISIVM
jgi:hypothetical protein